MLLEEALTTTTTTTSNSGNNNGSKPVPPSETAFALLSFLRDELPAGGIAAERRFVHLFPLLMERCFGRLVPLSVDPGGGAANGEACTPMQQQQQQPQQQRTYRHDVDGWLSMSSPPSSSSLSSRSAPHSSLEEDPLVRLLSAPRCLSLQGGASEGRNGHNRDVAWPTLLDAITAESHGVHLEYPLNALEQKLMDGWRECLVPRAGIGAGIASVRNLLPSYTGKEHENDDGMVTKRCVSRNAEKLWQLLPDQSELRAYYFSQPPPRMQQQWRGGGILSPNPVAFGSPVAKTHEGSSPRYSPRMGTSTMAPTLVSVAGIHSPRDGDRDKTVKLRLTMWQYYFFVFLRFPLLQQLKPVVPSSNASGSRSAIRQQPLSNYGSNLYLYLFSTYLRYYLPTGSAATNAVILPPHSELFLRLLMEFWLAHNPISTTDEAVERYVAVRGVPPTLREALELSRVNSDTFRTLPSKVQHGILATVKHLVGDLGLRESVRGASALIQERQNREKEGTTNETDNSPLWCLPPAMTVIQPLLLNYIRVGLACGSIHEKDSSFHKALEVWLVWLEPWNYVVKKRIHPSSRRSTGGGTPRQLIRAAQNVAANVGHSTNVEYYPYYVGPKPTSRSAYTPQWEAYVAANLHFYTVPLAIFLRRARELEFSSASEFSRSLAMVQRVLRCYPKPIVNVLNFVLNSRADAVTNGIVSRHGEVLGPYLPPEDWKLSSCQIDAMNLLDDIFVQYEKRVRDMDFIDRLEANIAALFSGKIGREEANVQSILSQLKCLVGLPTEYQVAIEIAPKHSYGSWFSFLGNASTDTQVDWSGPERTPDGLLTDLGRRQISAGTRKCSPFDVHYIGDPMLAPYQSYEVPALVDLTIVLSNYLNHKLGFVPWPSIAEDADKDEDILSKNIREMKRHNKIVFRLNLRFLADYRNVLALSFVIWIIQKLT
ncbi:hypothetical protein HJC23_001915 [Cyclotella cryptica]|uniref:Sphingomyelin phosphodiesterase 4 n=1 Tax=Cyclotella cryptica TaxID=29204 RepID=A0ABD3P2M7_9STRA